MLNRKLQARKRRHKRVRSKIFGTLGRPRLVVYRSLCHIYAQLVDDESGKVINSASSLKMKKGKKTEIAKKVGEELAKKAKAKNIERYVFDRSSYKYHGRIKALNEGAKEGGLKF